MALLHSEKSLALDGVDDYINLSDATELKFIGTSAFTVGGWFKCPANANATRTFFSNRMSDATQKGYIFFLLNGHRPAIYWEANSVASNETIYVTADDGGYDDDQWHHIAISYSGSLSASDVKIYVDNEEIAITIVEDTMVSSTASTHDVWLGMDSAGGGGQFEGFLDEMFAFNKELSAAEVKEIYNYGTPLDISSTSVDGYCIGDWGMGDGATYPTIPDRSSSGNDGTMTNMSAGDIVVDAPKPHEAHYSMHFDGVNEVVNLGTDVPELNFSWNDSFSICGWSRPMNGTIYFTNLNASYQGWGLQDTSFRLARGGTQNRVSADGSDVSAEYNSKDWAFVCATYDGSQNASGIKIYVNGIEFPTTIGDDSLNADITSSGKRARLQGVYYGSSYVLGTSFGYSAWIKELSLSEVQELYNNGVPRDPRTIGITSTLRGYWPLDDRDAFPTVPDLSVHGNNGTATNMEVTDITLDAPGIDFSAPSVSMESTLFEGDDNPGWVEIGDVPELDFEYTDSFSCGFWIKWSGTDSGFIVGKISNSQARGWMVTTESSGITRFVLRSSGSTNIYVDSDKLINNGQWHYIVFTYSGTGTAAGVTTYINGVQVPTTISSDNLGAATILNTGIAGIGSRDGQVSIPASGNIDNVIIYNKTLSEVEVRTLYGSRGPTDTLENMPLANLIGYWQMGDEATFPIIPDLSQSGNDGNMRGQLNKNSVIYDSPSGATGKWALGREGGIFEATDPNAFNVDITDTWSVSFWWRIDSSSNYGRVFYKRDGGTGPEITILLSPSGNSASLLATPDRSVVGANEILMGVNANHTDNVWRHCVMTNSGSGTAAGINFYVNGVLAAKTVNFDNIVGSCLSSLPMRLQSGQANGADGAACEFAYYDKELSLAEAQTLYGAGTPPDLTVTGPTGNLQGYWPIDSTDDLTTLTDRSSNGYDVAPRPGVEDFTSIKEDSPAPLVSIKSLSFDGVNDEVVLTGSSSLFGFDNSDVFSVVVWVKTTTPLQQQTIIGNLDTSASFRGWEVYIDSSGYLHFQILNTYSSNYSDVRTTEVLPADTWVSVICTYSGGNTATNLNIYINGLIADSVEESSTLTTTSVSTVDVRIGIRDNGSTPFVGNIDGVGIYNKTLSNSETYLLGGRLKPLDLTAIGPVDSLIGMLRMGDNATYPTIPDVAPGYDSPGTMVNMGPEDIEDSAASPLRYQMRGEIVEGYTQWIVEGVPDFAGNSAPEPVTGVVVNSSYDLSLKDYSMRGELDPGPGYSWWIAYNYPDFDGVYSTSPVIKDSSVITAILPWSETNSQDPLQFYGPDYYPGLVLWIDPNDSSTVFEDVSALDPAELNDTARVVLDKSGEDNNATSTGAFNGAPYKSDATLVGQTSNTRYLEFLGTEEFSTNCVPATGNDDRTLFFVVKNTANQVIPWAYAFTYGTNSDDQMWGIGLSAPNDDEWGIAYWASDSTSGTPSNDGFHVLSVRVYGGIESWEKDGVQTASYAVSLSTGSNFGIQIGSRVFGPSSGGIFNLFELAAYSEALSDVKQSCSYYKLNE